MNHGINFTEHFVKKPVVTGHIKGTVCLIVDNFQVTVSVLDKQAT